MHVGDIQTAIATRIAWVGQAGKIVPLVIHMEHLAASSLSQAMSQSNRILPRTGQDSLRKSKLSWPEFADHIEIALKATGCEDDRPASQFTLFPRPQVANQNPHDPAVTRQ